MRDWLLESLGPGHSPDDYYFAHCPERILPGQMLKELVSNDRIAGGLTEAAAERLGRCMRLFAPVKFC